MLNTASRVLLAGALCAAILPLTGCAGPDRRSRGAFVNDEVIEWRVLKAIGDDAELHERIHVNVTSMNGVVLLTGEAPGEALKQRAGEYASRDPDVSRVQNELKVAGQSTILTRSSDTLLTGKVKTALLNNNVTEATRIKVVTENGIVYLMGLVTRSEGDTATGIARTIGGVQRVVKVFEYVGGS